MANNFDEIREAGAEVAKVIMRVKAFLELLDDFSNLLLCIAKRNGSFEWISSNWIKELGWSKEELLAKPWIEFVHPEDKDETVLAAQRMDFQKINYFTNRYMHKNGSWRRLVWKTTTFNGNGTAYCVARVIGNE